VHSGYVVVCYVITTYVLLHVIQVVIVMIVWSSIIAVGVRIKLEMALESVLKEHCKVSDIFYIFSRRTQKCKAMHSATISRKPSCFFW
jgi:hypothetical protein